MKDKKRYYALDKVGYVGTQVKGSQKTSEKDIRDTVQFIKSKKSNSSSLKRDRQLAVSSKMS